MNIIYAGLSILLMIILLFLFAEKYYLHFSLLKILFKDEFKNVEFYQIIFGFTYLKINKEYSRWFFCPIYFKKNISDDFYKTKLLEKKLIKNRILIIMFFLLFLSWLFGISYLFFN